MVAPIGINEWDAALADSQKLQELAKKPDALKAQWPDTGWNILHKLALVNSINRIDAVIRGASESGQVNLLKTIASQLDKEGKSPLRLAAEANCGNAARKILEIQAPDLKEIKTLREIKPGMHIGLHHCFSSWWDGSSVNKVLSEALYQKSFLACLTEGKFDEAAIHLEGDERPNLDKIQDAEGNGPLSFALLSGDRLHVSEKEILKIVKSMIKYGADVNQKNMHEESVLLLAVSYGYKTIVHHLLFKTRIRDKIDVFSCDKRGYTAIHEASSSPTVDSTMLEFLLKAEPGFINKENAWGQTALHLVSDIAKAKMLLENGADIQHQDKERKIPLTSAIDGHRETVAAFLWKRDPRLSDGERIALRNKSDKVVVQTITVFYEKNKILKEDLQAIEEDTLVWNAYRTVSPGAREMIKKIADIFIEIFNKRANSTNSNNRITDGS